MSELPAPSATIVRPSFGPHDGGLADLDLIHVISVELIGERDLTALYGKIVDAAVSIAKSQFGTMQRLCPAGDPSGRTGELQLLYSRGPPPDAVQYWQWVSPSAHSSCTAALKTGQRAIISDFEAWDEIAGTEDLVAFRRTGIRSAQTTPLLSRNGELLGMISTHWSGICSLSARDLRLLDILARQAADLLERTINDEKLRESENRARLLAREAEHRTKNLLSTVLATVHLSGAPTADDLKDVIGGRIQALADVHGLIAQSRWAGADVRRIISQELAPYVEAEGGRACLSGPDVLLAPEAAQALAVTLHELATNAAKYGALSTERGQLVVEWKLTTSQQLELCWVESGGPAVKPPSRRGFGTRVMQGMVAARGGAVDFKSPGLAI